MVKPKETPTRTRLSPSDRRIQLLESAMALILERGLNAFTIELLAKSAGVSIPLVYKYFDTRLELLQAILLKEHESFAIQIVDELKYAKTTRDLIRVFVEANFKQLASNNIISLLKQQPDVAEIIVDRERAGTSLMSRFILDTLSKEFGFSRKDAELVAAMASASSLAAAMYYDANTGEKDLMIDQVINFIISGIEGYVGVL